MLLASGIAAGATMAAGAIAHAQTTAPPEPPDGTTVTYDCASEVPPPEDAILVRPTDDADITPVDDPTTIPDDGTVTRTWTFGADFDPQTFVQTITVADTTAPTGTAPADITVVGDGAVPELATIPGTDDCDGAVDSATPTDTSVGTANDRVITRTWVFTDTAGNTSEVSQTITVIPAGADLQITVDTSDGPVAAGDQLVYTVEVQNLGPDTSNDVVVTAPAFVGATFDDTNGCSTDPAGPPLSCSLGDLDDGAVAEFTVTVDVPITATGTISQTVTVASTDDPATPDPDDTNNVVTVETATTTEADLSVGATVTEAPVESTSTTESELAVSALAADDAVLATISVVNTGPSDATNATVTATFTTGITALAIQDDDVYTCSLTVVTLSCSVASHPAGVTAEIVVSGTLTGTDEEVVSQVTVQSDTTDPTLSNNFAAATVTIDQVPDSNTTTTTSETTTTVADATTTVPTTTIPATTIVVIVPTTVPPAAGGGSIPATGSDSGNILRASIIALLAGIAAVVIARRRPDLVAALRPLSWGSSPPADLPTRHVKSNGVSTVIEEPTRRNGKH